MLVPLFSLLNTNVFTGFRRRKTAGAWNAARHDLGLVGNVYAVRNAEGVVPVLRLNTAEKWL